jgi:alpha-tubulin suppressor-like RCC1 family protein
VDAAPQNDAAATDAAPGLDAAVTDAAPQNDAAPGCGDGVRLAPEVCDGADLGGQICAALGLPAGTLACRTDCTLDTTACAVCGDGICSDAETAETCVADCGVVDVAAGSTHSCAVLADGSVWCWGARDGHRMGGTGDVNRPVRLTGVPAAVEVAAGRHHSCIRTATNEVYCWGANGYGQVGTDPPGHEVFPPVQVATGTALYVAADQTCVRNSPLQVRCWGLLLKGRRTAANYLAIPGSGVLTVGYNHLCYTVGAAFYCLGRNQNGQLGLGNRVWRETATATAVSSAVALGGGERHTCYATAGIHPGIKCFGANAYGQSALVPSSDLLRPTNVSSLVPLRIDGGSRHTCAKETALPAPMFCWGNNTRGQLGNGSLTAEYGFTTAEAGDVQDFDVGDEHTCAVLGDGTARCWGSNSRGQIGHGSAAAIVALPVAPLRFGPVQ